MNKIMKRLGLLVTACMLGTGVAAAATPLSVNLNESKYMESPNITRLAVGNPEIADVQLLSHNDYLLVGKKAGSTSLIVWTNGERKEYSVYVSSDDQGTAQAIQKAIDYPDVRVKMINNKILLQGKVKNQYEHDIAVRTAQLYIKNESKTEVSASSDDKSDSKKLVISSYASDPNILDMLEMEHPSQIRLEALIIEINSEDTKNLGIQYWSQNPSDDSSSGDGSGVNIGTAGLFYGGEDFGGSRNGGGWLGSHISKINATLQALINTGKARILSRPSITTMSGQQASILIGGRIPVPISDGNNNISVDWREYGVNLQILSVVDNEDRITSNVHAEISTLDNGHAVKIGSYSIPALASREANAVVNVHSGMTMAIGGLLNSEDSKSISKFPLLGDLPIIGQFFRHTSTTRDKRELMILITPTLVTDDTPTPMTQRLKKSYELAQRQARNREDVNASYTPQGTASEEVDLWGEKPEEKDTIILEEKAPKKVPSYLLKIKGDNGEDILVPMTQEDYENRKDELQLADTDNKKDKDEKKDTARQKEKSIKKDAKDPTQKDIAVQIKKKLTQASATDAEAQRARIKAAMDRYSGGTRF